MKLTMLAHTVLAVVAIALTAANSTTPRFSAFTLGQTHQNDRDVAISHPSTPQPSHPATQLLTYSTHSTLLRLSQIPTR